MKRLRSGLGLALVCFSLRAAEPPNPAPDLFAAIRSHDMRTLGALLLGDAAISSRDPMGNTPLHAAALCGYSTAVSVLLRHGAEVNATNNAGATPLLYGAHHAGIVRDLLAHAADPNIPSINGQTPLLAAATCGQSYEAVRLLIEHRANVDVGANYGRALPRAIVAGDQKTIDLLIRSGGTPCRTNDFSPLASAALMGDLPTARQLLDAGVSVNHGVRFAGHPLNWAFYGGSLDMAALLIERGADLRLPSTGGDKTSPMIWSAYNDSGDPGLAQKLITLGIDVNTLNSADETALDWAMRQGTNTPLVQVLLQAGGHSGNSIRKKGKPLPNRLVDASMEGRAAMIKQSIQRAVDLLETTSSAFIENGFVQNRNCVSCHQQNLPAVVFGWARERGFELRKPAIAQLLRAQVRDWTPKLEDARQVKGGDSVDQFGWAMIGLHSLGYAPDERTEALVRYLLRVQKADGSWPRVERRPPIQDDAIVATVLAVRAVQLYPVPGEERESMESLDRARYWLARAKPQSQNQRAFQLLGLGWAGESSRHLTELVSGILAEQRPNGGWAQLPGRECDAWATGQALVALHQAGGLPVSDAAYQRGIEFLLRTEFDDGSWWVQSRTWPIIPYFDSKFPHGKDQWISAAGTAWATMALLLTIEPTAPPKQFPTAQALLASTDHGVPAPTDNSKAPEGRRRSDAKPSGSPVDFVSAIKPLLERSCVGCHSGEKAKGSFRMEDRAALLKGGQSGEAAILERDSERSPLLSFVSDRVEDLEMPPIGKREKYPPLAKEQIETLRLWIDQGAVWPAGITLNSERKSL
jgi:ankyrin repeat protein